MSVTVNCHIDDETVVSVDQLGSGAWTIDIGPGEAQVTLFASADRLRSLVRDVLTVLPDEGGACLVCGDEPAGTYDGSVAR